MQHARPVTLEVLTTALEDDLELAPFDTFAARLRRFFIDGLPELLTTPWQQLPWHVDYSCNGCEFLGYPWLKDGKPDNDPNQCWPEAERCGHLSMVAGLSRGNARQLGVSAIVDLADLSENAPVFERSPTLRAQRTRFPGRAKSLRNQTAGQLPDAGSDAQMPKWPDLHIYVFVDYDLASAITVTFALRAFWSEPLPIGSPISETEKHTKQWNEKKGNQEVFVVSKRKVESERNELLKFLRALRGIMTEVRTMDDRDVADSRRSLNPGDTPKRSTYQIYLWDEAQRRHLQRVVGRHLPAIMADTTIRDLAWLFPPPELLANPEAASIRSPFTIVSRVVQNTVAVPLPHHYTLFGVAQLYHSDGFEPPKIHPLYREPLSDLIPSERIHELWTERGDWTESVRLIKQTAQYKLLALGTLVTQLERDLKSVLNAARLTAPVLGAPPNRLTGLPLMNLMLYEFTRLNAALQDLEKYTIRAMPAHEREARFRSAHLTERLEGAERINAIVRLSVLAKRDISTDDQTLVYRLAPNSRDLNARPGDRGFALSPRTDPGFLQQHPYPLVSPLYKVVGIGARPGITTIADAGLTSVSIIAIDRTAGLIVLKRDTSTCVQVADGSDLTNYTLEQAELVNLAQDVMLDPVDTDFLTNKVKLTLQGIGYPELAQESPTMRLALGLPAQSPPASFSASTPAAHFLWNGPMLAATNVTRDVSSTRAHLEPVLQGLNSPLNESQWGAWQGALTYQLSVIWGPPGTGKSHTLRALVAGAVIDAHTRQVPLRLLVSANNYSAVDNVLERLHSLLSQALPGVHVPIYRLTGQDRIHDYIPAGVTPLTPIAKSAPPEIIALKDWLDNPAGIAIIGAIPHQIHNLAFASRNKSGINQAHKVQATQKAWFDLIVIDEASQMDVALATLVVSKAAENAAFVLAGDDLQLPPIHQADPPKDLERHVGSVFEYVRHVQGAQPLPLNVNYRSNQTMVNFFRTAGYDDQLHAYSPDLSLSTLPLPNTMEAPVGWPDALAWSANWADLLNCDYPATAYIYTDDTSGQANDFEADAVVAMIWLLYGRMHRKLLYERDIDGSLKTPTTELYDKDSFWGKAVGVVTPHKAQMSKIVGRLQAIFPNDDPEKIRAAVDTVERFQGQQRDVIIASFGIGDPDLIRAEDEFIYSLRRFNVLVSRARAKLIILSPESLIDHLSNDATVLEESRLLKRFAETYCQPVRPLNLPYYSDGTLTEQRGNLRQR